MVKSSAAVPGWYFQTQNQWIADQVEYEQQVTHCNRVWNMKPCVDDDGPNMAKFQHLVTKPKTRKLEEDRAAEIQLENRILLQKMLLIDSKPSPLSGSKLARERPGPRSIHAVYRKQKMREIEQDNKRLLNSIDNMSPTIIRTKDIMKNEHHRKRLMARMSGAERPKCKNLPMPKYRKPILLGQVRKSKGSRIESAIERLDEELSQLSFLDDNGDLIETGRSRRSNLSTGSRSKSYPAPEEE